MSEINETLRYEDTQENFLNEINMENAHDAEDGSNSKRHEIPVLDYDSMSMEDLIKEFKKLVQNEAIQTVKRHVEGIKSSFEKKCEELEREKKQKYVEEGGDELDFEYKNEYKDEFDKLYERYKIERDKYYEELENKFKENKVYRENIINGVKKLVDEDANVPGVDSNSILKKYKELKALWYEAGPVSRKDYDNLWNDFNFHSDRVFDYLEIDKELREEDFKRNLEKKENIIKEAEALLSESNIEKAFRKLQNLHRLWKEETGPVEKELREVLWNKFRDITKQIHERRQLKQKDLEKMFAENEQKKKEIIEKMRSFEGVELNSHQGWQKSTKDFEELREEFFKIGRVSNTNSEEIWGEFKEVTRNFNKRKYAFYKEAKKQNQELAQKRREFIEIAKQNVNRTDWSEVVPAMKKLQEDWKKIGFLPGKQAQQMWDEFRGYCNEFFDKYNKQRKEANSQNRKTFAEKNKLFDQVKEFELTENSEKDLESIKDFISKWEELNSDADAGQNKPMDIKFNRMINDLYKKIDVKNKQSLDLLKYNQRLENIDNDKKAIANEQLFVRKKIEKLEAEIAQLEGNIALFSNISEKSPLIKDVYAKLNNLKILLETWKEKQKEFNNFVSKKEEE